MPPRIPEFQICGELAQDVDILCVCPVPYTEDHQALTRICAEPPLCLQLTCNCEAL